MSLSCGLNLKDVVRHLLGGDASLPRMSASHGVPMEESTDGSCEKFAITIAQSHNGRSASGDRIIPPLSSMSEVLGIKELSYFQRKCSGTVPPSNRFS